MIELEKAKDILEIYRYDFEIPNNKIKIIFNKSNQFQISIEILKEVFEEYQILGNIKYSADYNLYINKNTKYSIDEKEYEKIYNKLFERFDDKKGDLWN